MIEKNIFDGKKWQKAFGTKYICTTIYAEKNTWSQSYDWDFQRHE
jgi:hypothetical protein